eukprot:Filipodium_phascolosomae@DN659_c0_g1_i1.p1
MTPKLISVIWMLVTWTMKSLTFRQNTSCNGRQESLRKKVRCSKNLKTFFLNGVTENSMSFVALKVGKQTQLGKEGTERLARVWKVQLSNWGVDRVQVYAIDAGRILITTLAPGLLKAVKDFVVEQPETDWFEYDSKKFFPPGRNSPLTSFEERDRKTTKTRIQKEDF